MRRHFFTLVGRRNVHVWWDKFYIKQKEETSEGAQTWAAFSIKGPGCKKYFGAPSNFSTVKKYNILHNIVYDPNGKEAKYFAITM